MKDSFPLGFFIGILFAALAYFTFANKSDWNDRPGTSHTAAERGGAK